MVCMVVFIASEGRGAAALLRLGKCPPNLRSIRGPRQADSSKKEFIISKARDALYFPLALALSQDLFSLLAAVSSRTRHGSLEKKRGKIIILPPTHPHPHQSIDSLHWRKEVALSNTSGQV